MKHFLELERMWVPFLVLRLREIVEVDSKGVFTLHIYGKKEPTQKHR